MRQIGFKNFRRFENFPALDLAPITIFVGENNAGKSTVVKGILALSDFMNSRYNNDLDYRFDRDDRSEEEYKTFIKETLKNIKFYFNSSYLVHIGSFKRALFNKAVGNAITFTTNLGLLNVSIEVKGNRSDDEAVSGNVSTVAVDIDIFKISLLFDLDNDKVFITFRPNDKFNEEQCLMGGRIRESLSRYFQSFDKEYTIDFNISSNWRPYRGDLIASLMDSIEVAIDSTLFPISKEDIENGDYSMLRRRTSFGTPIEGVSQEVVEFLKMYCETVLASPVSTRDLRGRFRLPSSRGPINRMVDIEYLYAHAVTQTVVYSAKDTNDYLSRTIHEFAPMQGVKHKRNFILDWMKEFGIGSNFSIKSVGGEAHIVYITNSDGEKVNLADKGMGSIQLMVLLFRLAITLPKIDGNDRIGYYRMNGKVVIIEEPEQNLHPMLQSKLADLFYKLNKDYGYRFIIETHSEYLIRKTQVIVKNNFNDIDRPLKENPFKVYYFNSSSNEKPYYEIEYQNDGNFFNDFGRGFFDEASNLAFEIL